MRGNFGRGLRKSVCFLTVFPVIFLVQKTRFLKNGELTVKRTLRNSPLRPPFVFVCGPRACVRREHGSRIPASSQRAEGAELHFEAHLTILGMEDGEEKLTAAKPMGERGIQ